MKCAVVTCQSQIEGFDRKIPVSAVGIIEFDLDNMSSVPPKSKVYTEDTIEHAVSIISEAAVSIVFHADYTVDILSKYFEDNASAATRWFSIQEYIYGEIEQRVYMNTVAKAVGLSRTVSDGRACVSFYKNNQWYKLMSCIRRDLDILYKTVYHIMHNETLVLTHDLRTVEVDISAWKHVLTDLAKPAEVKMKEVLAEVNELGDFDMVDSVKTKNGRTVYFRDIKSIHTWSSELPGKTKRQKHVVTVDTHDLPDREIYVTSVSSDAERFHNKLREDFELWKKSQEAAVWVKTSDKTDGKEMR